MLGEGLARNLQRAPTLLLAGGPQLLLLQAKPRWLGQLLSLRWRGARIRAEGGNWSRERHAPVVRCHSLENRGRHGRLSCFGRLNPGEPPLRLSARC